MVFPTSHLLNRLALPPAQAALQSLPPPNTRSVRPIGPTISLARQLHTAGMPLAGA